MTTDNRHQTSDIKTIEVCFSPALYPYVLNNHNYIVVIIDILRASTAICSAFQNGVEGIIPVSGIEEAREYKNKGFVVAAEREGVKLDFADFGNSPFNFTPERVKGKSIAYSTTNGTEAINTVKDCKDVVIGCFTNLSFLTKWLALQNKNVLFLCSGWKQKFCLEDTVCAGAFVEELMKYNNFCINCDSASASLDLWKIAKNNLLGYLDKAMHRHRLQRLGLDDVLEYSFTLNTTNVIPKLQNGKLINICTFAL
jgi:2-phosphosulfolactate phosphatase